MVDDELEKLDGSGSGVDHVGGVTANQVCDRQNYQGYILEYSKGTRRKSLLEHGIF